MARRGLHCHGHGASFPHRAGADLHCSEECAGQHRAAESLFVKALQNAGFHQSEAVPNLWERDGVQISIEQVMREGMDETLARHRAAVAARGRG
jgi:hypothetical protein